MKPILIATLLSSMCGLAGAQYDLELVTSANVNVPNGGYLGDGMTYTLNVSNSSSAAVFEFYLDESSSEQVPVPIIGGVSFPDAWLPQNRKRPTER